GALDMSLPSTPDIRIKEEEPVEVDSSPPDSPASRPRSPQHKDKELPSKPLMLSTPTPTIVRPGSLPLHLGYDPLHPTLPSPTSVITQAPPSNRQLGGLGWTLLGWAGHCPLGWAELGWTLTTGLGWAGLGWAGHCPLGWTLLGWAGHCWAGLDTAHWAGHCCPFGQPSWGLESAAVPFASGAAAGWQELLRALRAPLMSLLLPWQRLKASLAASSSLNGGSLVVGSASTMVSARPEQSQLLVQHPDAPSPAQPQVSPAQPTPSTGGRRKRAVDEDPDERRQRFLERNRAAASRCRQKRKLWVSSLEKKAEELTSQNIQLSNEVTLLRNEVAQLKQLLLAHKDCPVTALQKKTQGYLGE
ncbi:ATF7 factor, partial [Poecile atricapillus]|nr:ATF7 factor [Poecile atricapillus]